MSLVAFLPEHLQRVLRETSGLTIIQDNARRPLHSLTEAVEPVQLVHFGSSWMKFTSCPTRERARISSQNLHSQRFTSDSSIRSRNSAPSLPSREHNPRRPQRRASGSTETDLELSNNMTNSSWETTQPAAENSANVLLRRLNRTSIPGGLAPSTTGSSSIPARRQTDSGISSTSSTGMRSIQSEKALRSPTSRVLSATHGAPRLPIREREGETNDTCKADEWKPPTAAAVASSLTLRKPRRRDSECPGENEHSSNGVWDIPATSDHSSSEISQLQTSAALRSALNTAHSMNNFFNPALSSTHTATATASSLMKRFHPSMQLNGSTSHNATAATVEKGLSNHKDSFLLNAFSDGHSGPIQKEIMVGSATETRRSSVVSHCSWESTSNASWDDDCQDNARVDKRNFFLVAAAAKKILEPEGGSSLANKGTSMNTMVSSSTQRKARPSQQQELAGICEKGRIRRISDTSTSSWDSNSDCSFDDSFAVSNPTDSSKSSQTSPHTKERSSFDGSSASCESDATSSRHTISKSSYPVKGKPDNIVVRENGTEESRGISRTTFDDSYASNDSLVDLDYDLSSSFAQIADRFIPPVDDDDENDDDDFTPVKASPKQPQLRRSVSEQLRSPASGRQDGRTLRRSSLVMKPHSNAQGPKKPKRRESVEESSELPSGNNETPVAKSKQGEGCSYKVALAIIAEKSKVHDSLASKEEDSFTSDEQISDNSLMGSRSMTNQQAVNGGTKTNQLLVPPGISLHPLDATMLPPSPILGTFRSRIQTSPDNVSAGSGKQSNEECSVTNCQNEGTRRLPSNQHLNEQRTSRNSTSNLTQVTQFRNGKDTVSVNAKNSSSPRNSPLRKTLAHELDVEPCVPKLGVCPDLYVRGSETNKNSPYASGCKTIEKASHAVDEELSRRSCNGTNLSVTSARVAVPNLTESSPMKAKGSCGMIGYSPPSQGYQEEKIRVEYPSLEQSIAGSLTSIEMKHSRKSSESTARLHRVARKMNNGFHASKNTNSRQQEGDAEAESTSYEGKRNDSLSPKASESVPLVKTKATTLSSVPRSKRPNLARSRSVGEVEETGGWISKPTTYRRGKKDEFDGSNAVANRSCDDPAEPVAPHILNTEGISETKVRPNHFKRVVDSLGIRKLRRTLSNLVDREGSKSTQRNKEKMDSFFSGAPAVPSHASNNTKTTAERPVAFNTVKSAQGSNEFVSSPVVSRKKSSSRKLPLPESPLTTPKRVSKIESPASPKRGFLSLFHGSHAHPKLQSDNLALPETPRTVASSTCTGSPQMTPKSFVTPDPLLVCGSPKSLHAQNTRRHSMDSFLAVTGSSADKATAARSRRQSIQRTTLDSSTSMQRDSASKTRISSRRHSLDSVQTWYQAYDADPLSTLEPRKRQNSMEMTTPRRRDSLNMIDMVDHAELTRRMNSFRSLNKTVMHKAPAEREEILNRIDGHSILLKRTCRRRNTLSTCTISGTSTSKEWSARRRNSLSGILMEGQCYLAEAELMASAHPVG